MTGFIKTLFVKYNTFIKFCLVGLLNSVLSVLIYNALLYFNVNYSAAYITGFVITWFISFNLNGRHVFKPAGNSTMPRYLALYLFSMLLGNAILYLLADGLHLNKTLAQLPVIAVGTAVNYTGSKYWVFKEKHG